MSGYRVMAGVGKLDRGANGKPDEIPVPVYVNGATKGSTTCCLTQLTNRIGAGVTMSLSRTRNNNYIQEMGLREFTTATSGMYEVDFSFDGIFSPSLCKNWLAYAFMMGDENSAEAFEINNTNKSNIKCYTNSTFGTVYTSKDTANVYAKLVVTSTVGSAVEGTARAYNTINVEATTYKFYTDAGCTQEYTGSSATKQVYVKAIVPLTTAGAQPIELKTTTAIAYSVAKTAEVKYYTDAEGTTEFTPSDSDSEVYVALTSTSGQTVTILRKFGQPVLYGDIQKYLNFVGDGKTVTLFGYTNLTGPKYFDLGYQKINIHASGVSAYDSYNEMGVLVGCIIDSASMSYESGSDAGVRFSISGHALRDIEMITSDQFDYSSILDPVPTEVFVGGCVSVYDPEKDAYVPVAQTDSAAISIANNTQKLGNCLKLNYSSYAMGALTYDVSTSTYSNDPNKYLKYFYGYEEDMTPSGGETIGSTSGHYFIGKAPVPIGHMKIRTDDTSAIVENATMFMDINMTDVFVGDMSNSYSVDTAIMDEPSMRTKKVYIAVGYTPSS